jgi:pimeloyl-ACP methyl ester carboxylesterase
MNQHFAHIEAYKNEKGIEVPSHKISFHEWNPEGSETLVCIHSLITNSGDFTYIGDYIDKDFRVIAIDIPGRGDSDWFDNPELYDYDTYIPDMLALFKHLNIEKTHFLGASMGGIIGMVLASKYPDLIESLILNDIGPEIPGRALAKIRKYIGMNIPFPSFDAAKDFLKMAFKNFGITSEAHWDHLTEYNIKLKEDGSFRWKYDLKIAEKIVVNMDNPEDVVFWEVWDQIKSNILLIHGEKSDMLVSSTVDKMSERPNTKVYLIKSAGHPPALHLTEHIKYIESWLMNIKQES